MYVGGFVSEIINFQAHKEKAKELYWFYVTQNIFTFYNRNFVRYIALKRVESLVQILIGKENCKFATSLINFHLSYVYYSYLFVQKHF